MEVVSVKDQDGARKCVDRVLSVLFTQFKIIVSPSQLFTSGYMVVLLTACNVSHNMVAVFS